MSTPQATDEGKREVIVPIERIWRDYARLEWNSCDDPFSTELTLTITDSEGLPTLSYTNVVGEWTQV